MPILSNVLLQGDGDKIAVRATDLELTLEHAFSGRDRRRRARSRCRPSSLRATSAICRPGMLELTGTPTRASVKCERCNYDFHALPADEYPPLPAAARGSHFTHRRQAVPRRHRRDDLRRLERRSARRRPDGHAARSRRRLDHDGRDRRLPARQVRDDARRGDQREREVHRALARAGRSGAQSRRRRADRSERRSERRAISCR